MILRESLPLDIDPDDAADAEAMADYEAGRFISHEAMRAWILSWGTESELPRPEVGD
jgi:predicted transcriptional regulator